MWENSLGDFEGNPTRVLNDIYTSKYKYTSITIILLCFWISYSLTIRQIVCFFQISSLPDRSFFRKWISSMILKVNVTKQIEISVSLFNVNCNIFSSCISLERVFFQIWVYKKLIMIKFSLSMPTSRTNIRPLWPEQTSPTFHPTFFLYVWWNVGWKITCFIWRVCTRSSNIPSNIRTFVHS